MSLGALNSILLSKCNLIESQVPQNSKKFMKKAASTFNLIYNKQNDEPLT